MRQIDKIRKEIPQKLNLPKELVNDVLMFTYRELLQAFSKGDKIEMSGLGLFSVRENRRQREIERQMIFISKDEEHKEEYLENLEILKRLKPHELKNKKPKAKKYKLEEDMGGDKE